MKPMLPGEFSDWAHRSQPGASVVIARGERLPADLGAAVNRMAALGMVAPCRKREGAAFVFIAQRNALPIDRLPGKPMRGRGRARRKRVPASADTVIMTMIRQAIARGEPCPTNDEFARRARLSGKVSASDRLKRLVRKGVIAIEDFSPYGRRVVTICATGESTVRGTI